MLQPFTNLARIVALAAAVTLMTFGLALAQEGVHWSYEGDTGPEHWGSLSPNFAACAKGVEQSPIDIPADAPLNPADIAFNYKPSAVNIFNNGHTIQVNYDQGSSLALNGITYNLVQFHFHAASEHAIDGKEAPMELHLVHKSAQGALAVVGVLLWAGSGNDAYAPVFQNLPPHESQPAVVAGATLDANKLLPAQRTYWRYNGSLTTPPCTEGVKWLVMNTPVELSDAQIAAFTAIFKNDQRPVQPFNSRSFLITTRLPGTSATVQWNGLLVGAGALMFVAGLGLVYVSRRKVA